MQKTTETQALLLLVASQLFQAADKAPTGLRKRLQLRGEQILDEAEADAAPSTLPPLDFSEFIDEPVSVPPLPAPPADLVVGANGPAGPKDTTDQML